MGSSLKPRGGDVTAPQRHPQTTPNHSPQPPSSLPAPHSGLLSPPLSPWGGTKSQGHLPLAHKPSVPPPTPVPAGIRIRILNSSLQPNEIPEKFITPVRGGGPAPPGGVPTSPSRVPAPPQPPHLHSSTGAGQDQLQFCKKRPPVSSAPQPGPPPAPQPRAPPSDRSHRTEPSSSPAAGASGFDLCRFWRQTGSKTCEVFLIGEEK